MTEGGTGAIPAALFFCTIGGMRPALMVMAGLYIVAGIAHFLITPVYTRIMPPWLPAHALLVQISGLAEILGGVGLLLPVTRRAAAWGLVALLIAVMPANVQMALNHAQWPSIPQWVLWMRLPLQLPLMVWAWWYTR